MKKNLLILTSLFIGASSFSQTADFQTTLSQVDTSWFGQDQTIDGDTTFQSGSYIFSNSYNMQWGSFTGWSYSNHTDITTPGFLNQFSSITGNGEASDQYGVCYTAGNSRVYNESGTTFTPTGAYFTNTTYTYLSMQNGDNFAKQFGSSLNANGVVDSTDGEDWLLLSVYGLNADSSRTTDFVELYLADYRFTDSTMDYLVNSWEYLDLSSLGSVYGLDFQLSSTDNSTWGMNTPSYFAMDNLSGTGFAGIVKLDDFALSVYPNPTLASLNIEAPVNSQISLFDIRGKLILNQTTSSQKTILNTENMAHGIYVLSVNYNGNITTKKVVKK